MAPFRVWFSERVKPPSARLGGGKRLPRSVGHGSALAPSIQARPVGFSVFHVPMPTRTLTGMSDEDETVTLRLTKPEVFALAVAVRMSAALLVGLRHSLETLAEEFPLRLRVSPYMARRLLSASGPGLMEKLRSAGGGL